MKRENALLRLVRLVQGTDLSYNVQGKQKFHRLGREVCRHIAAAMGLPEGSYDIRSNMGGDAVGGEVILHGEHIYIQLSQSFVQGCFMYRWCSDRKDYCGGTNQWMRWEHLLDFPFVIGKFKAAAKM